MGTVAKESRSFHIAIFSSGNWRFVVPASFSFKFSRKFLCLHEPRKQHEFPGGLTARVTPVPIPNTEVKPCRADDTALVTARERRSPPGLKFKGRPSSSGRPFSFLPRAISAAVNLPDFYWMPTKPVTVLYSAFYTLTRWKTSDAYF